MRLLWTYLLIFRLIFKMYNNRSFFLFPLYKFLSAPWSFFWGGGGGEGAHWTTFSTGGRKKLRQRNCLEYFCRQSSAAQWPGHFCLFSLYSSPVFLNSLLLFLISFFFALFINLPINFLLYLRRSFWLFFLYSFVISLIFSRWPGHFLCKPSTPHLFFF
jgi:hypothetical protein